MMLLMLLMLLILVVCIIGAEMTLTGFWSVEVTAWSDVERVRETAAESECGKLQPS